MTDLLGAIEQPAMTADRTSTMGRTGRYNGAGMTSDTLGPYVLSDFNGLRSDPSGAWSRNDGSVSYVILNCRSMPEELTAQQVTLSEGLKVKLYMDDCDDAGERCLLVTDAIVHYDHQRSRWYAELVPRTFREEPNADRPWRARA
jgi:hypothetical protein